MKQRSPEWYEIIKNTIGGSDVPTILGINPFKRPIDLYNDMVGIHPLDHFESAAMKRGTELEDEARQWYNTATGNGMYQPDTVIHSKNPYLRCSLDGINFSGDRAIEIKSPGEGKISYIIDYGVQPEYYAQIQYAFWFFPDLKCIDLVVYQGELQCMGRSHAIFPVYRDQKFIDDMNDKIHKFIARIVNCDPPPDDRVKTEYLQNRTIEWREAAHQYQSIKGKIDDLQQIKDDLDKILKDMSNGQNMKGAGISITHTTSKGFVDYKAIPELKGVDLDKYRKRDVVKCTIRINNNDE